MSVPPTNAPFLRWDWDIVQDADLYEPLPQLLFGGEPINLTGCTVDLHVRPNYAHATPIVTLTSPTSIVIDDPLEGLMTVHVPKLTVDDWPLGEWTFFLRVIDGGGGIAEVARGPFNIHPGNIA